MSEWTRAVRRRRAAVQRGGKPVNAARRLAESGDLRRAARRTRDDLYEVLRAAGWMVVAIAVAALVAGALLLISVMYDRLPAPLSVPLSVLTAGALALGARFGWHYRRSRKGKL